jgi:lipoprotein LpqH
VAGAAILVAGISGCSSNKPASSGTVNGTSFSVATPGAAATPPTVTIDGKNQNVSGQTVCTTVSGDTSILIGGSSTGISAVIAGDNSVKAVVLGNVNGVTLGFTAGTGKGNASATKNGNSYKITGNATGVDMANPMQPVNKPFEIDVACS